MPPSGASTSNTGGALASRASSVVIGGYHPLGQQIDLRLGQLQSTIRRSSPIIVERTLALHGNLARECYPSKCDHGTGAKRIALRLAVCLSPSRHDTLT